MIAQKNHKCVALIPFIPNFFKSLRFNPFPIFDTMMALGMLNCLTK